MTLSPIQEGLGTAATSSVENAIKASLLSSISTTNSFDSVLDVDVVLQDLDIIREEQLLTVGFEVHVTFYDEDLDDTPNAPDEYTLDSLIARTFSQPSSTSEFLSQLTESRQGSLQEISKITIIRIEMKDRMGSDFSTTKKPLSPLDIVLISLSGVVFIGLLYCLYLQQQELYKLDERSSPHSEGNNNLDRPSQQQVETQSLENRSPAKDESNNSNILCPDDSEDSSNRTESSYEISNMESIMSPPVSMSSSINGSEEVDSSQPQVSSPNSASSEKPEEYLLGARTPTYSNHSTAQDLLSPFAAKLLRLPTMDGHGWSFQQHSKLNSSSSAPGKLMVSFKDGSNQVMDDQRSHASPHSTSDLFMGKRANIDDSSVLSICNSTDLPIISEQKVWTSGSEDFEQQWKRSQKLAEQDDEASSEDVFHVGENLQTEPQDNQSQSSGFSAVSEWMKCIRVVGRSSETKASDMSNSSAEHSSVEPKSMQFQDLTDESLEGSLATSVVDH